MSDGKSFTKKILTDAERIDDLERKLSVILERIQVYDRIVDENRVLTKKINDLSSKPNEIHERISDLIKSTDDQFKIQNCYVSGILENIEEIKKTLSGHVTKLAQTLDTQTATAKYYEKILKDSESRMIAYCDSKMDGKEFKDFKEQYYRDFSANTDEKLKLTEFSKCLKKDIEYVYGTLKDAKAVINEQGKGITGLKLWLNGLEDKLIQSVQDQIEKITSNQSKVFEDLRSEVQSNKQEILGTPTSNAAVERRIMNRLEMASLDGKNAMIVTKNHAEKIELLEKKIDSLNAQLTRYEIK